MGIPTSDGNTGEGGPNRSGLQGWSIPPVALAGTAPVAGTLQLVKIDIRQAPMVITNVILGVFTLGTTLTSGQNFAMLYGADGTKLGQTVDMTATWGSLGLKVMALTAPVTYHGPWCWVGFYARGTATPLFARGLTLAGLNFGQTAGNANYATANTALTTTPPATLGAITAQDVQYFAAIS